MFAATLRRYLFAWLGMWVLAILNGLGREFLLTPHLTLKTAHQISTLTLLVLFAGYIYWLARRWPIESAKLAWSIGAIWLVLTLAFEFGFGLAGGHSWAELLSKYDLSSGDLWVLIPLAALLGPWISYRFMRPKGAPTDIT